MTDTVRQTAKATIILAQVFISCMMAFLMTLIFTGVPLGFGEGWVVEWLRRFITAWPVAFLLSLVVGPLSFRLAALCLRRQV